MHVFFQYVQPSDSSKNSPVAIEDPWSYNFVNFKELRSAFQEDISNFIHATHPPLICSEEEGEEGEEGRKENLAMEMAGEIALQMDGWIDGNSWKHWGGVSGPHQSPAIIPITSSTQTRGH